MLKRFIATGLLLLGATGAQASILVSLDHVAASGSSFDWVYNVNLEPDQLMTTGDYFTVYDFKGLQKEQFTPGATVSDRTFAVTEHALGPTPSFLTPMDSASLTNVNVKLTEGANIVPAAGAGEVSLGQLTLTSNIGVAGPPISFTAKALQQGTNMPALNIGTVNGPGAVPEPATVSLLGAGLLAVGVAALRRRSGKS
jgi:hypothetical protein